MNRLELGIRYQQAINGKASDFIDFLHYVIKSVSDIRIVEYCKVLLRQVKDWAKMDFASKVPFLHGKDKTNEVDYYDYHRMPEFDQKKKVLEEMLGLDKRYMSQEMQEQYMLISGLLKSQNIEIKESFINERGYITINQQSYAVITKNEVEELKTLGEDIEKAVTPINGAMGIECFVLPVDYSIQVKLLEIREMIPERTIGKIHDMEYQNTYAQVGTNMNEKNKIDNQCWTQDKKISTNKSENPIIQGKIEDYAIKGMDEIRKLDAPFPKVNYNLQFDESFVNHFDNSMNTVPEKIIVQDEPIEIEGTSIDKSVHQSLPVENGSYQIITETPIVVQKERPVPEEDVQKIRSRQQNIGIPM
mgnify:CR=1 FL=1